MNDLTPFAVCLVICLALNLAMILLMKSGIDLTVNFFRGITKDPAQAYIKHYGWAPARS